MLFLSYLPHTFSHFWDFGPRPAHPLLLLPHPLGWGGDDVQFQALFYSYAFCEPRRPSPLPVYERLYLPTSRESSAALSTSGRKEKIVQGLERQGLSNSIRRAHVQIFGINDYNEWDRYYILIGTSNF